MPATSPTFERGLRGNQTVEHNTSNSTTWGLLKTKLDSYRIGVQGLGLLQYPAASQPEVQQQWDNAKGQRVYFGAISEECKRRWKQAEEDTAMLSTTIKSLPREPTAEMSARVHRMRRGAFVLLDKTHAFRDSSEMEGLSNITSLGSLTSQPPERLEPGTGFSLEELQEYMSSDKTRWNFNDVFRRLRECCHENVAYKKQVESMRTLQEEQNQRHQKSVDIQAQNMKTLQEENQRHRDALEAQFQGTKTLQAEIQRHRSTIEGLESRERLMAAERQIADALMELGEGEESLVTYQNTYTRIESLIQSVCDTADIPSTVGEEVDAATLGWDLTIMRTSNCVQVNSRAVHHFWLKVCSSSDPSHDLKAAELYLGWLAANVDAGSEDRGFVLAAAQAVQHRLTCSQDRGDVAGVAMLRVLELGVRVRIVRAELAPMLQFYLREFELPSSTVMIAMVRWLKACLLTPTSGSRTLPEFLAKVLLECAVDAIPERGNTARTLTKDGDRLILVDRKTGFVTDFSLDEISLRSEWPRDDCEVVVFHSTRRVGAALAAQIQPFWIDQGNERCKNWTCGQLSRVLQRRVADLARSRRERGRLAVPEPVQG
ncbi:hypothetical protein LTS10_009080 [Elasticomyces elasticus]|nr:hypothetical protein LTS10_009080 [Elasticomyces elasticus]